MAINLLPSEGFHGDPVWQRIERLNANFADIDADISRVETLPVRYTPTSITLTAGGTPVGTVAGVQTMFDGEDYQVPELAEAPGYDIRFNFTGLTVIPDSLCARLWYDGGGATHRVDIEMWDYVASGWVAMHEMATTASYRMHWKVFVPEARFVEAGSAIVRWNHISSGNTNHDAYFDYVGLWRASPYAAT